MQRQCIVIRRIIHNNQGVLRNVGKQLLTEPFTKEIMIHLAVIISRFPCTFEHQFGVGYPAVLRHRMHNNEPLAFPCWFLYPRPIFLPVPDKIIAMVFIYIGLIQIHFRTNDIVTLTIPPFFTEVPVASCHYMVFFLQVLGARTFAKSQTPSVECTAKCSDTEIGVTAFRFQGIHVRRDTLLSIAYSEELISSTISATLQSTDRHHGIVGQERCHFQLDS